MLKKRTPRLTNRMLTPMQILQRVSNSIKQTWRAGLWQRTLIGVSALLFLFVVFMYSVAQWYYFKHRNTPVQLGATFIPDYAAGFGLDPEQTMNAMINDLGVKRFRLVSYWEKGEAQKGKYDFSFLDWQMKKAHAAGAKVTLAIGLRQPRWPECHWPSWAQKLPKNQWEPLLKDYIKAVVERYKNHPALESWQLENEYFLKVFGECPDFSRDRLVSEYKLVKDLDLDTPVVISMSNNAIGMPIHQPTPDEWAISIYKRVWDKTITRRYYEYPIPAWYYAFRAGFTEATRGRNVFAHELQAEPWLAEGYDMRTAPTDEYYKSLNPERLAHRFRYGVATGMKKIDLWGAEWWYYMKEKRNSPELWNVAKEQFAKYAND